MRGRRCCLSFEIKSYSTSTIINGEAIGDLHLDCRISLILPNEESNIVRKVLCFSNDVMGFRGWGGVIIIDYQC
jgi:hypothetical protein